MKVKTLKKILSFVTSLTIIGNLSMLNASAAPHMLSYVYKLQADMPNLIVEYGPTYATHYGELTMRGAFSWATHEDLSFDMFWNRVSSATNPTVTCTIYRDNDSTAIAATSYYYNGNILSLRVVNSVEQIFSNWDNCMIKANAAHTQTVDTFAHEFGHVLGLGHDNDTPTSIMAQRKYRTAVEPSDAEISAINYMYG